MIGHRIVIADDEPTVLSALAQLLESAGHAIIGKAATGEEAVWMSQTLDPDVVFLDVQMPGMDGIEAAGRIMDSRPAPIVICTAHCNDDLVNSAANNEAYAYVVKPCRLADLVPAMGMAVSRFQEARLLKSEVESLKETLTARKLIEQAKGIVMQTRGLSEHEAHRFLQQESQRQSKPLSELAKAIVLAEKAFSPKVFGERTAARTPA